MTRRPSVPTGLRIPRRGARTTLLGTTASALLAASAAPAQTVEDVVRRYVDARGGIVKLSSVHSLRLTGTMELPGVSAPFTLELKRPGKMRTEFTVEGQTGVRAWDGRAGWKVLPLPGEGPRAMDPDEAAEARAAADVDLSPLVDSRAKGYSVELVGRDRLPGGDTWKLVVRGADGPPRTLHLDARTHLTVRVVDRRELDGREAEFVTEIGEYRSVGGLVFPHRMEVAPKGSADRQRLVVRRIEVNPPLPDSRFARPGPAPARREAVGKAPAVLP